MPYVAGVGAGAGAAPEGNPRSGTKGKSVADDAFSATESVLFNLAISSSMLARMKKTKQSTGACVLGLSVPREQAMSPSSGRAWKAGRGRGGGAGVNDVKGITSGKSVCVEAEGGEGGEGGTGCGAPGIGFAVADIYQ